MKRIIITLLSIWSVIGIGYGQQSTNNTVDQSLRSSGRVNPSTLGMEFSLPLGNYAGRGFNLPLGLSYSSKVWRFENDFSFQNPVRNWVYGMYSDNAAAGWTTSLAQPYIEYTGHSKLFDEHGRPASASTVNYKYIERINVFLPGGESHELRASDDEHAADSNHVPPASAWEKTFCSYDGSGLKYVQDSQNNLFRLYLPDGSFYDFNTGSWENQDFEKPPIRRAIRLTDANGNYAQYNGPESGYPYGSWTDQLDRKFPIIVPLSTPKFATSQSVLTQSFYFPGVSTPYVLKWKRLEDAFAPHPTPYVLHYVGGQDPSATPNPPYSPALFANSSVSNDCGATSYLFVQALNLELPETVPTGSPTPDYWSKFNPMVLAEIELPNDSKYEFKYNEYGEIETIGYPAGGHEEFAYDSVASLAGLATGYQKANRGVTVSRVYENDSDQDPMTSYYFSAVSDSTYRTSVIGPDGVQTDNFMYRGHKPQCDTNVGGEYHYNGLKFGYDSILAGKTYETRTFTSTGDIFQRTLTNWDTTATTFEIQYSGSKYLQRYARVATTQSETYDENGGLAAVTSLEYDLGTNDTSSPLNVKAKKEYSYFAASGGSLQPAPPSPEQTPPVDTPTPFPSPSASPVRITETTYLTTDSNYSGVWSAYKDRNLLKLPTQVLVKDGASTTIAKSQIAYDDQSLLNDYTGTVPGWSDPGTTVRGLPTLTTNWYDISGNHYIQTQTQYNKFGSPRKTLDGNGNLSQIEYTDNFSSSPTDRHTYAFATKTISAVPGGNGSTSSFETHIKFQYPSGLPVSTSDMNGQETTLAYDDALLRPTLVTAPNGQQTITEYGEGTSASTRWVKVKSQVDDDGGYDYATWKESTTWYDGLMRTVRSQSKDDEAGDVFALTCYDTAGRISKVSNPFRGYTSQTCSTTTGMDWTTNTFDSAGRPWKVTAPDSSVVETNYSLITSGSQIGTSVTVTDQAGRLRRSITNALGHLVRVDEPGPSSQLDDSGTPTQPTIYTYDLLNNLLTVNQASSTTQQCGGSSSCSQTRTFTYDALSRLLSAANPESGTTYYAYDANGNLTSKKDARNITTNYTYDALNRVNQRSYATPTATPTPGTYQNSPTVTYYYDGANISGGIANSKGKLTKVTSSISTTEYTSFDILGRVTASKQTTDGGLAGGYTMGYTYNLSGALKEETYPSGRVVKNVLDQNGDLSIVKSRKNGSSGYWNYADSFTYNPAGAVTSMQLGNGRWESTTFNNRLQPSQIALGTTINATNLLKLDYTYSTSGNHNNNGNILTQTITVPNSPDQTNGFTAVQSYTYDELNRIKSATETVSGSQTWKQAFDYDRYGNRKFDQSNTSMPTSFANTAVTNPTISTSTNRITSSGWGYDAAGNTLTDANSQTYVYDGENKMVKALNGGGTLGEYYYDGEGKRVKKIADSDGGTTIFVYDAGGKLVAEYSYAVASAEDAKVSYLTGDNLGSPRINTDRDGVVISRHDYHPFGEEIVTSQRTGHPNYTPDSVRKQFTGYERDDEIDLDFAQLRTYSAKVGRFFSVDLVPPDIYTPPSLNKYEYCLNNPLRFIDSSGGYEEDVHRDLTVLLAQAVGFSREQANLIGKSNQWCDEPESGLSAEEPGQKGYENRLAIHFADEPTRYGLWKNVEDHITAGNNPEAYEAIGTFLHSQQDSFSHNGFDPLTGQLPAALDNLNIFSSYKSMEGEARKYDKTTFRPELAEEMARDTFSRLLIARNKMAANGKFGAFAPPVSYSDIESQVSEWVRANPRRKQEIMNQIRQIIRIKRNPVKPKPKPKKTKVTVKVLD